MQPTAQIVQNLNPSKATKRFPTMKGIAKAMLAAGYSEARELNVLDRQFEKKTPHGMLKVFFASHYNDIAYWPQLNNRDIPVMHVRHSPTVKMIMINISAFERCLLADAERLAKYDTRYP